MFAPWLTASTQVDAWAVTHGPARLWQARQTQRLHALLQAAANGSRWWRARLGDAAFSDEPASALLPRLPVAHKHELTRRFADWVTDPALELAALRRFTADASQRGVAFAGKYMVWESSGSSGEPALFVHDAQAMAVYDALEATRGAVALPGRCGVPPLWRPGARLAFVGAIDGPFASIVSLQRQRRLNPWLATASRAFSFLQPVTALVEQLNQWQPAVLACYPSMAWVLAQEQRAGRLALRLDAVWTGGETLTPGQRSAIGEAFDAPVHDSYGASECFTIAGACRHGHLHLNADWAILEPVDAQGCPVPAGELGTSTLLTNLANHAQPIIRCDIGDRVRVMAERCACGSALPVIEVQGRSAEVMTFDDGHGLAVHLCPLALSTVLEDAAGVFDFQLRQVSARRLALDVASADADGTARASRALRDYLSQQGLKATRVDVHAVAGSPSRGRSGKQRRLLPASAALNRP
jgi:phenylacetate-CoA ligase